MTPKAIGACSATILASQMTSVLFPDGVSETETGPCAHSQPEVIKRRELRGPIDPLANDVRGSQSDFLCRDSRTCETSQYKNISNEPWNVSLTRDGETFELVN